MPIRKIPGAHAMAQSHGIDCTSCGGTIWGARWTRLTGARNVELCDVCYATHEHDPEHILLRVEQPLHRFLRRLPRAPPLADIAERDAAPELCEACGDDLDGPRLQCCNCQWAVCTRCSAQARGKPHAPGHVLARMAVALRAPLLRINLYDTELPRRRLEASEVYSGASAPAPAPVVEREAGRREEGEGEPECKAAPEDGKTWAARIFGGPLQTIRVVSP